MTKYQTSASADVESPTSASADVEKMTSATSLVLGHAVSPVSIQAVQKAIQKLGSTYKPGHSALHSPDRPVSACRQDLPGKKNKARRFGKKKLNVIYGKISRKAAAKNRKI